MAGLLACQLSLWLAACGADHHAPAPHSPSPLPVAGAAGANAPPKAAAAEAPTDELLITFHPDVTETRRHAIHQLVGCQVIGRMLGGRIAQVRLPPGKTLEEVQSAYQRFLEVQAAEPNSPVHTQDDDPSKR